MKIINLEEMKKRKAARKHRASLPEIERIGQLENILEKLIEEIEDLRRDTEESKSLLQKLIATIAKHFAK